MNRDVCGLCWCPYDEDGTCGCPGLAGKPGDALLKDVEGFLSNQELRELAKEAGIDPDDFVWELEGLNCVTVLGRRGFRNKAYDEGWANGRLFEKTHSAVN